MTETQAPSRTRRSFKGAKIVAAILAVLLHLGLVAFLIFNVHWRNKPAAPVTAELYAPPRPEPVPTPPPEPPKPPQPEPPPAPPPPPPPPPPVETKPSQADIELKAKQEKERIAREKRDQEKRDQEKRDQQKREQAQREAKAKAQQEREAEALRQQAERERVTAEQAALVKAANDYTNRIRAKIRGNIVMPPDVLGNPEAEFDVLQLPTGEVIDVQLRKSSGFKQYDSAVEHAILKSSPLPKPDRAELFQRTIRLKFRPEE